MTIKMTGNQAAQLRARWVTEVAQEINVCLSRTGAATSPFGEIDGLVDLRGLPLSSILKSETIAMAAPKPIPLKSVPPIKKMDFSHGHFVGGGQFSSVEVEDCRFDFFELGSNWRRLFRRCSFVKAKLKRAHLGGIFEDCDFSKADLSQSVAGVPDRFVRCNFQGCSFKRASWTRVVLEHCDFSQATFGKGTFHGATFTGGAPSREQFGDTIVDRAVFG